MKYPKNQLEILTNGLKKLAVIVDIKQKNPNALHYIIFEQYNEGHKHNWLYCFNGQLKRAHQVENLSEWEKLFSEPQNFELYPDGCNDSHIETAVNSVIKQMYKLS